MTDKQLQSNSAESLERHGRHDGVKPPRGTSILLAGVGGQGTILVAKLLTAGLVQAGHDVKMSEIHGMSQRGGSITTQIRFGAKVFSPTIDRGRADILVSFEEMETYRWLPWLKPGGKVIMNDYRQPSAPMLSGRQPYPEGLQDEVAAKAETTIIDAAKLAAEAGLPRAMNLVLMGALIRLLGLEKLDWAEIIKAGVKPQFVAGNLAALNKGLET